VNIATRLWVGLAVLSLAAGCNCTQKTNTRAPVIQVINAEGTDLKAFDFGKAQVKVTTTATIRIRNDGAVPLTLQTITFTNAVFGAGVTLPMTIAASDEFAFPLTFAPTEVDTLVTGSATITCDDPVTPSVTFDLQGTGVTAVAVLSPNPLAFGDVYTHDTRTLTFTLTNAGSHDLTVLDAGVSGLPAEVTVDLSPLRTTLAAGANAQVTFSWSPTALDLTNDSFAGALDLDFGPLIGAGHVPVSGRVVEARPRLCFKFDDSPMETCTDVTTTFLALDMGALCDGKVSPADGGPSRCHSADGGLVPYTRGAQLYYRNEGNTPVAYSVQYLTQAGVTCDAGSSVDFELSNAPVQADGGPQPTYQAATVLLPDAGTDPKPWESAPITVVYRARSGCRADAADQARVLWSRQNEPFGANRAPTSLILTLTGQSLLPRALPTPINMNGSVPQTVDFRGVSNAGSAPLPLTKVELWQGQSEPDGGRSATPFERCAVATSGDCKYFGWATDPAVLLGSGTFALPAAGATQASAVLGQVTFGPAGGPTPVQHHLYTVYAVIDTGDPYAAQIVAPVTGVMP
jgi:hypothetical protein